jgi:serine/threonine protein kinase
MPIQRLDLRTLPGRLVQTPLGTVVVLKPLGSGTAAAVFQVQHLKSKTLYALKVLTDPSGTSHRLKDSEPFYEFVAHRAVQEHPHVVSLLTSFDLSGHTAFLLEHADGGDLLQHLMANPGGFSEAAAKDLFTQVSQAVAHAHSHNVLHRDIKLENILLVRDSTRPSGFHTLLADWGYATPLAPGRKMRDSCGSLHYCAPEVLSGRPYDSSASDCWSLGVLLYALLTGRFPFFGRQSSEIVQRINEGLPIAPRPEQIPREAWALIHQCLLSSPESRIAGPRIVTHRWIVTENRLRSTRRLNSDMGTMRHRTLAARHGVRRPMGTSTDLQPPAAASSGSSHGVPLPGTHGRFVHMHPMAVNTFKANLGLLKSGRLGTELACSPRLL